jgi:hypothetical protein
MFFGQIRGQTYQVILANALTVSWVPEGAGCWSRRSTLVGLAAPNPKSYPQRSGVIHKKSMKTLLFHDFGG